MSNVERRETRDDEPAQAVRSVVDAQTRSRLRRAMKRRLKPCRRGRPPVPIERDPQRFEIACWWAFTEMGLGKFDAARRALLATKGGPITLEGIEGVLVKASATIPLPQPFDPEDLGKGLRRLSAKAQRAAPSPWLINSGGLVQGLITFIAAGNTIGVCLAYDGLLRHGWGPVILGLADRIEAALKSNLPPAEIETLSPAVRRLLAELRQRPKK
jgi:hypothetical protein